MNNDMILRCHVWVSVVFGRNASSSSFLSVSRTAESTSGTLRDRDDEDATDRLVDECHGEENGT